MVRNTLSGPFYLEESASMPGKYVIRLHHDQFYCTHTDGSYAILPARLLNISYANFLRLARDEYGAVIYGKNSYYPTAYFDFNTRSQLLVETLNQIATLIIWRKEHTDALEWNHSQANRTEALNR